jgi:transposase
MFNKKHLEIVREKPNSIIPLILALANKILSIIGFEDYINNTVEWDEKQCNVSPGALAKTVILSTFFDVRSALSNIEERFQLIDTELLLGSGIKPKDLTDDSIGRTLDKIAKADPDLMFRTICLTAYTIYELEFKRLHSDTTTISFYGDYDLEEKRIDADILEIVRGFNKDHLPQCKQVVLGKIVNEHGIPLASSVMNGNTSDIEWNKKAVELTSEIFKTGITKGIYIADSKLMTSEIFTTMMNPDKKVKFISRCPANFSQKIAAQVTQKAYNDDNWVELGTYGKGKRACEYSAVEYTENVYGYDVRLVVVKSSAGIKRFETQKEKELKTVQEDIKKTNKKKFACKADAQKEWQRFLKKHKKSVYSFKVTFEENITEKRPRGNPGKNPKPPKKISIWYINIEISGENKENMDKMLQAKESFVLITNTDKDEVPISSVLGYYKNQIKVELNFKLLKDPCIASVIFLKKPERIRALTMLLGISLLVRALIQYKIRKTVSEYEGELPKIGQKGCTLQTNPTINFLQEEIRNQYFEKTGYNQYKIAFTSPYRKVQSITFLEFIGFTLEDLLDT